MLLYSPTVYPTAVQYTHAPGSPQHGLNRAMAAYSYPAEQHSGAAPCFSSTHIMYTLKCSLCRCPGHFWPDMFPRHYRDPTVAHAPFNSFSPQRTPRLSGGLKLRLETTDTGHCRATAARRNLRAEDPQDLTEELANHFLPQRHWRSLLFGPGSTLKVTAKPELVLPLQCASRASFSDTPNSRREPMRDGQGTGHFGSPRRVGMTCFPLQKSWCMGRKLLFLSWPVGMGNFFVAMSLLCDCSVIMSRHEYSSEFYSLYPTSCSSNLRMRYGSINNYNASLFACEYSPFRYQSSALSPKMDIGMRTFRLRFCWQRKMVQPRLRPSGADCPGRG